MAVVFALLLARGAPSILCAFPEICVPRLPAGCRCITTQGITPYIVSPRYSTTNRSSTTQYCFTFDTLPSASPPFPQVPACGGFVDMLNKVAMYAGRQTDRSGFTTLLAYTRQLYLFHRQFIIFVTVRCALCLLLPQTLPSVRPLWASPPFRAAPGHRPGP